MDCVRNEAVLLFSLTKVHMHDSLARCFLGLACMLLVTFGLLTFPETVIMVWLGVVSFLPPLQKLP